MTPVPWPLFGRAAPPPAMPTAQRPGTWRTCWEHDTAWVPREAHVLDLLADAGGDLRAHRTVHLEDR